MARQQTQDAGVTESTQVTARGTRRRFTVDYKGFDGPAGRAVSRAGRDRRVVAARGMVLVATHAVAQAVSGWRAARVVAAPRADDRANWGDGNRGSARARERATGGRARRPARGALPRCGARAGARDAAR